MQNLKRNWLVVSKLTWGIWQILTRALENLKNFHFNALLLSKVYIAWAKKVQMSYISSHWREIQNLERNLLVVSKLTCGIWQILTWALKSVKNFHINGFLLSKVYIIWAQRSYLSWHWRVMQNSRCGFKNHMRNLANFCQSTRKWQNWDLDEIFLSKEDNVWA